MSKNSEPFFQPSNWPVDTSSQHTGPDSCGAKQPSAGKLPPDSATQGLSPAERTGPDIIAAKQQSAGKLKSDLHRHKSTSGCTGPDTASSKHKSTGKPHTDPHWPVSLSAQSTSKPVTDRPLTDWPKPAGLTGSDSPTLHKTSRKDSISSLELEAESDFSDTPQLNCLWRRVSSQTSRNWLNENYRPQRSRHTGKWWGASVHSWGGLMYQT